MGRYNSRGIYARNASENIESALIADQVSVGFAIKTLAEMR